MRKGVSLTVPLNSSSSMKTVAFTVRSAARFQLLPKISAGEVT
jgi:hypothetical protein